MPERFIAVTYVDGRPVVTPGTAEKAHITDEWLQYLLDSVREETLRVESVKNQGV